MPRTTACVSIPVLHRSSGSGTNRKKRNRRPLLDCGAVTYVAKLVHSTGGISDFIIAAKSSRALIPVFAFFTWIERGRRVREISAACCHDRFD
jgi:hypothetical protein